jgi:2-hydroxychromene-2-carboxylate isomerase
MTKADWYFDFISPFSYFQLLMFDRLPDDLSVTLKPVLFAGLLGHWEHKGPAEIPAKRRHTYRYCQWFADRHGIPFTMPPAHPFNPLGPLRLAIAAGSTRAAVAAIFGAIWGEGVDVASEAGWARLAQQVGLDAEDARSRIADQAVKDALRANTEEAAARGAFGVPSFVVDGEVFWGVDSTEMFLDYLQDPEAFRSGEMARLADLPIGQARKL